MIRDFDQGILIPETREVRQKQWSRVAGDFVVLKEDKENAVNGKQKDNVREETSVVSDGDKTEKTDSKFRSILLSTNIKRWKCVEKKRSQRQQSFWDNQPTAMQELHERYLHKNTLLLLAPSRMSFLVRIGVKIRQRLFVPTFGKWMNNRIKSRDRVATKMQWQ